MMGLYFYGTGMSRQCVTVLSTLGLSESYTNLMSKNVQRKKKIVLKEKADDNPFVDLPSEPASQSSDQQAKIVIERTGTLHQLSDSMRERARSIAKTGLFSVVYQKSTKKHNLNSFEEVEEGGININDDFTSRS